MKKMSFLITVVFILIACNGEKDQVKPGNLAFHFQAQVNGSAAVYNKMQYTNAAGNQYEITNIQWFISDVGFINKAGDTITAPGNDWIHYVDSDLPETQSWTIKGINPGEYSQIVFVFGIEGSKNIPNMFTDPPESNMLWPYMMGGDFGGYHYMKLNGFWMSGSSQRTPFNCHLGVGQVYGADNKISGFVQNWFEVALPSSAFKMSSNGTVEANLNMNIQNWFESPDVFNWNDYGGAIMNNQEAMGKIRENGKDVFTIEIFTNETGS